MTSFTPRPQWIVDLIEELSGTAGTAAWGGITGTLTAQTDLQAALDAKAAAADIAELSRDAVGAALVEGGGIDIVVSDAGDTITISASTSGATLSGPSFPGSPTTGDVFRRTDRQIEYYYDGTRWLSTQLFETTLQNSTSQTATFATDIANPWASVYSIYITNLIFMSRQTAGVSSSNYFTCVLQNSTDPAAPTAISGTLSAINNTLDQYIQERETTNAVVANTVTNFRFLFTEVGTATAILGGSFVYRLIG